jgi:P4 family phage/plasmid primase-like protien
MNTPTFPIMSPYDFALQYAANGWPVFPCDPRTKKPLISKWPEFASIDPASIENWRRKHPDAMIGIQTGPRSGIFVVDVDLDTTKGLNGEAALAELGQIPATATVSTPRGGKHYYFKYDSQTRISNSASRLAPGVDVRGEGGYVIAAGSINSEGKVYGWDSPLGLFSIEQPPEWLLMALKASKKPSIQICEAAPRNSAAYFEKVLIRETEKVGAAAPGTRNDTLNKASYAVGRISYLMPEQELPARRALYEAAMKNGLVADDGSIQVQQTIESGFTSGQRNPRGLFEQKAHLDAQSEFHKISTLTQLDIARHFIAQNYDGFKYDQQAGRWFIWTGSSWKEDKTRFVYNEIRRSVEHATEEVPSTQMRMFRNHQSISAIEKICANDPAFSVSMNFWDSNPFLLGTPCGTVDLTTGNLLEPNPKAGISKTTNTGPAEDENCPKWKQFLLEACNQTGEMVEFLQIWCGNCLTGDVKEQTLIFVYGPGGNGKSVFVNTIMRLMGDYAKMASMDTFTVTQQRAHETEIARLCGARIVVANETEEGRSWAEAKIKAMTGGDRITARFMRQDFFEYDPQFKLIVVGNHQPNLRNVDDAIRRRLLIVPFTTKPDRPDPNLEKSLREEFPGILRWMINGALKWQKHGLPRPECVLSATNNYFSEQDLFGEWLDQKCTHESTSTYLWATVGELFNSWKVFALEAGENPGSKKNFSAQLEKRRFRRKRLSGGLRGFEGLSLKRDEASHLGADGF